MIDYEALIYGIVAFCLLAAGYMIAGNRYDYLQKRDQGRLERAEMIARINRRKKHMDERDCQECGGACNWGDAYCKGCLDKEVSK